MRDSPGNRAAASGPSITHAGQLPETCGLGQFVRGDVASSTSRSPAQPDLTAPDPADLLPAPPRPSSRAVHLRLPRRTDFRDTRGPGSSCRTELLQLVCKWNSPFRSELKSYRKGCIWQHPMSCLGWWHRGVPLPKLWTSPGDVARKIIEARNERGSAIPLTSVSDCRDYTIVVAA